VSILALGPAGGVVPVSAPAPIGSLRSIWESGLGPRREPLERARRVSALTVPHLIPPEGTEPGRDLPDTFQSVGARGLNNLAARLQLTLLPPSEPWLRYEISPADLRELGVEGDAEDVTAARLELAQRAEQVQRWVNVRGIRGASYEFFRHVLVAGTSVMRLSRETGPRLYRLPYFQVSRKADGSWWRLLTCERVTAADFTDDGVRAALGFDGNNRVKTLYRVVELTPDQGWISRQECDRSPVPGSLVVYGRDEADVPWIVSRFGAPPDEDYGRSLGEETLGDLRTLEGLTQALAEAAAIAAEVKWAVSPGSGMTPFQLMNTPNGGCIGGEGDLVKGINLEKGADLSFALQMLQRIETRVELGFLLRSAIQRDAERVTAEEIRAMMQELEVALGGGFSTFATEFQAALAKKAERILERTKELPPIPSEIKVDLQVITGLEALARGQERLKLLAYTQDGQNALGPEEFSKRHHGNELLRRLALTTGVNPDGLLLSDEEVAQQAEADNQNSLLQTAAPQLAQALGRLVENSQTPG